jgi:hypothetical protein
MKTIVFLLGNNSEEKRNDREKKEKKIDQSLFVDTH